MKITLQWLKKWTACSEGVDYYKAHPETDPILLARQLMADNKPDWCNWLIARALSRKGRIRYAVYAARQCAKNYNTRYPDDNRINEAIAAAERVIERDTAANRAAAESAWSAARSAGIAARSADIAAESADSAWSAAMSAGIAAGIAAESADSAWSAAMSAWSAARSAGIAAESADSAWSAAQTQILNYGIALLEDSHA